MNQNIVEIELQEGEIIEITPDMIVGDVIEVYPEVADVFRQLNINCFSCQAATRDSIAEAAILHRIHPQKLCLKINNTIKKHRKNEK